MFFEYAMQRLPEIRSTRALVSFSTPNLVAKRDKLEKNGLRFVAPNLFHTFEQHVKRISHAREISH